MSNKENAKCSECGRKIIAKKKDKKDHPVADPALSKKERVHIYSKRFYQKRKDTIKSLKEQVATLKASLSYSEK
jgi:DNA-directed RNA polymerase subunit RPC12/RpoP